jgi:phosphate transport system permease protein
VSGSGIFASYILALGRALGETMAVTMLIGNTNHIPQSLTDTGNTMASVIANQFGEADGVKLSSLIAIGLILFLITAVINFIGRLIIKRKH